MSYIDILVAANLKKKPIKILKCFVVGSNLVNFTLTFLSLNICSVLMYLSQVKLFKDDKNLFILQIVVYILSNYYIQKTFLTEPGIIPKNIEKINNLVKLHNHTELLPYTNTNSNLSSTYLMSLHTINLFNPIKYCTTCEIFRPPRSSHCKHCENCVKEYEHHCYLLGCCIGQRNITYFQKWLTFQNLHFCMLLSTSYDGFVNRFSLSLQVFVIVLLIEIRLIVLLCFQVYLLILSTNTKEFYNKTWKNITINPYKAKNSFFGDLCKQIYRKSSNSQSSLVYKRKFDWDLHSIESNRRHNIEYANKYIKKIQQVKEHVLKDFDNSILLNNLHQHAKTNTFDKNSVTKKKSQSIEVNFKKKSFNKAPAKVYQNDFPQVTENEHILITDNDNVLITEKSPEKVMSNNISMLDKSKII